MNKIMTVFLYIDLRVLLNATQVVSVWSQKILGLTNFWWAKFFLKVAIIAMSMGYILNFCGDLHPLYIVINTGLLIYWFALFIGFSNLCTRLEEKYARGCKYINERAVTWVFHRIVLGITCGYLSIFFVFVAITSNQGTIIFTGVGVGAFPFIVYFISCTPLPPTESKLKTWLFKSVKKKIRKDFFPESEPEPASC